MARKSYWQRFQRERISRRRVLGAAGVGAAGLAVAAACGGGDGGDGGPTPTPGGEDVITKDGTVHASTTQTLETMDVFGSAASPANLVFAFTHFDHLFYVPLDTQKVEWMLVEEAETPDPEALEYIYTIGVSHFHDKPPVNAREVLASDVKASFEAYKADTAHPATSVLRDLLESVDAIDDDRKVIMRATQPSAWWYHASGIAGPRVSNILPVEIIDQEAHGVSFDRSKDVIGSGRFMNAEDSTLERRKSLRHRQWRIEGEPYMAGRETVYIGESAAALAAFRAKQTDVVFLANRQEADDLKAELGEKVEIESSLNRLVGFGTLQLNINHVEAFQDARVRRAFNRAIDRQALIQGVEVDPEGGVFCGPLPAALEAYLLPDDEMEDYFRHDPEEAKQLLQAANFPFDKAISLKHPSYATGEIAEVAQLLKEQLGEVGVKVNLVEEDMLATWWPKTLPGDFEMTIGFFLPYDDPQKPLSFHTKDSPYGDDDDPRGKNSMGFFDDDLTDAFEDINSTVDEELVVEKVKDMVRLIMEKDSPMINLYSPKAWAAYWHWFKGRADPKRGAFGGFWGREWIDTNLRGF